MESRIKGVIFDADGTLLDSMGFWDSTVVDLVEAAGALVADRAELTELLTPMSMEEGANYLKTAYSLDISVDEIIDRENKIIESFYANTVTLREGTPQILKYLKEKGIPMAIATATDSSLIKAALRLHGIEEYFTAVVSCSDIGKGKSSPDVYMMACKVMNTLPCETLVAEDSLSALLTAKRAGFQTMAVYDSTQKRYWEQLSAEADFVTERAFSCELKLSPK